MGWNFESSINSPHLMYEEPWYRNDFPDYPYVFIPNDRTGGVGWKKRLDRWYAEQRKLRWELGIAK